MKAEWDMVLDFHQRFNHPIGTIPRMLDVDRVTKRGLWMQEELNEFLESKNIYEQADAMIDLIYFALGSLVEMGIPPDELFAIVHEANMAKLWEDGKAHHNADGKTIKPTTWTDPEPKIIQVIERLKSEVFRMKNYTNTLARSNFCAPAVLCTILNYEGYKVTQETIAEMFGLTVPLNTAEVFKDIQNVNFSNEDINWGVKIEKNSINDLFFKLDAKLHETFIPINTVTGENLSDVVSLHLFAGEHIVCGFNYSSLYSLAPANYRHASIICNVNVKEDRIFLLDPGPKDAGIKSVLAYDLYLAIMKCTDGLWCISRTDQHNYK